MKKNYEFEYLVNVDELRVEELPIAGEDRLTQVNEVLEGRRHTLLGEEGADVSNLVGVVPEFKQGPILYKQLHSSTL